MSNAGSRFGKGWQALSALAVVLFSAAGVAATPAAKCADCDKWNEPAEPFQIYGNSWYVGTKNLSSILITSDFGHVLLDGGLPQSAPLIAANIESLGFKVQDIKAILVSHAHFDHAGGISQLQRQSGAQVYARRPANEVLSTGKLTRDDPQFGTRGSAFEPVENVWVVQDDQLLGIGSIRLRAIGSPGHTPGSTTWTWESCDNGKCLTMVYADSLTPVSAPKFRFTDQQGETSAADRFAASIDAIGKLKCDVLITPHPEVSGFLERIAKRPADKPDGIADAGACERYAQSAREALAKRVAEEG
jgi:metallo-beta-lactamase class B